MTSIRLVLGLAAAHDLEIVQLDVKTAFHHGDLEEDIYMCQPEGFEVLMLQRCESASVMYSTTS
ncbi:reverse transcriptase domain-containing protein, partial [Mycobacterium tuberculosis]